LALTLTRYGVVAAASILSARSGLTLALLVPSLGRLPSGGLQWDALRTLWSRLRPLLAGSMYFKSDLVVDRALASMAPAGHLSLLALAFSVYSTASQIVSRSLVAPAVVGLSRLAARRDWRPFAASYAHHLRLTMLASAVGYVVVLAAAAGVLSFGVPGVVAPRSESTRVFLTLLAALGGYFAGGCVGQVVSGRFYATGDTTWPTRVGAVGFTAGIALKALGFYLFGVVGIALGTSSYYVANALTLHAIGRRATRAALVTPTAETRP
jgi:putative peptidoglycan lipid II flippase